MNTRQSHKITMLLLALITFSLGVAQPLSESVVGTKHNLSLSGMGAIRSTTQDEVCIFCHTPHSASGSAPLWNRTGTATLFSIYPSGGTVQSIIGQPNGSSRICLSCHDGTIALGLVRNPNTTFPMSGTTPQGYLPAGSSNLGSILSDDHPTSFTPSLADAEIVFPPANSSVKLDANGQMQCRSCHDPHNNQYGSFLVQNATAGALCTTCHMETGWDVSQHNVPSNPLFGQLTSQACNSCHISHNSQPTGQLVKLSEETLCFSCHDGVQNEPWETSGASNLVTEFSKVSRHPLTLSFQVHSAGEGPINSFPPPNRILPEDSPITPRHVECVDCHNSHAVSNINGIGQIDGSLKQQWGVGMDGLKVDVATAEYQICLKCHGDSQNLPANSKNKRLQFAVTNASYHPVFGIGRNTDVPGLIAPWTVNSVMNCTDCHNSDDPAGPQGPHGSNYPPLLKRQFQVGVGLIESPATFDLCYSCHSRTVLFHNAQTYFQHHERHVSSGGISCLNCHSSHGSTNRQLIYFDPSNPYLAPSSSGRLEFIDLGNHRGQCFVSCHGRDHNPKQY